MRERKESCPSVEELQQHISETPENKSLEIEKHVRDCIFCIDIIEWLKESKGEEDTICEEILQEVYLKRNFKDIQMPERFVDAVQSKETLFARIIEFLMRQIESLKNIKDPISYAIKSWWGRPRTKFFVPITAAILLTIIYLLPPYLFSPTEYSDLAILEKARYQTLRFKGPVALTPAQKLFYEGMESYEQDEYDEASRRLAAYLEHEPNNAFGHFYLGVSQLLEDEIDSGIEHLRLASDLSQEKNIELLIEKCHWYLGNAYLKINEVENALIEFRKTIELPGEFDEDARMQITRIEEIRKKKDNK